MDPISILNDSIELASKVVKVFHYIDAVGNATESMRIVQNDTARHFALIQSVHSLIQENQDIAMHFESDVLSAARQTLMELHDLVGGDLTDLSTAVSKWKRIKWPLKEPRLKEIHSQLERHMTFINASFGTALFAFLANKLSVDDSRANQILGTVAELNNRLDFIEKQAILKHCLPPNRSISELHKDRKRQQEAETCDWITRDKSFNDWLSKRDPSGQISRFLWIYGIPGCGKSVLASSIIERAANNCCSLGYAYYYCLYSREQDETVPFLQFILRMLCKQKQCMVLPSFHQAHASEEALSVENLLDCLEQVSLAFDHGVHIIIDAVDESKPRETLLDVLCQIGTDSRFWKVSLLFTSREESDIMESMKQLGNSVISISMSNGHVRDDIKRYIQAQLTTIPSFANYDSSLISEVENSLVNKSKGMFRWAVCQLDVLRRTRGRESVRTALEKLPKDIFATYERILVNIPQTNQEFARTALALICSNTANFRTAEILVNASLANVPFNDISSYTVKTLKECCGSLISLTDISKIPSPVFTHSDEQTTSFRRCALAHYTVKEYLFSPDVAKGEAKFFALSDEIVGNIDLKVVFAGLDHLGRYRVFDTSRMRAAQIRLTRYEGYCLEMTEKALSIRRSDILRDEDIMRMVIKSLTPAATHFLYLNHIHGIKTVMKEKLPNWHMLCSSDSAFHDHPPTGLMVNLAALKWRELANKYLESPEFKDLSRHEKRRVWTKLFTLKGRKTETVLGYCIRENQLNFLRVFVRHGASFDHEPEALYTAMKVFDEDRDKALEALKFLLGAGAYPNPAPIARSDGTPQDVNRGFAFTPLQYAISELEYDWVELLLEEGADVNRPTTSGGVIPSSFDSTASNCDDLHEIGQQTPLKICRSTQPTWIEDSSADVDKIRENIRVLLKRYGAEETYEERAYEEETYEDDEDESMLDIGAIGGNSEIIDLTDNNTGYQHF